MSAEKDGPEVVSAPALGRYELRDAGRLIGQAQYVVVPVEGGSDRVVFFHTEVDEA